MNTTNATLTQFEFATFVLGESLRGFTLLVQIVLLVLCVAFRNHQPLKSRSWFPIAYMLCKVFEQCMNICYLIPISYFSRKWFHWSSSFMLHSSVGIIAAHHCHHNGNRAEFCSMDHVGNVSSAKRAKSSRKHGRV